jgi:hypothetical protein
MVLVRKIFTPKKESTMKTTRFLTLAAIYIALTFTLFACSSDSGGGGSDDNQTIVMEEVLMAGGEPPAGVVAVTMSDAICINFGAVSNADGYYIYRSNRLDLQMNLLDSLKTPTNTNSFPTYCDRNVEVNGTYYYRVAAYIGNGALRSIGSQSSIASATMVSNVLTEVTMDPPSGGDPSVGIVAVTRSNAICISFGDVSNADGYYIYRDDGDYYTYSMRLLDSLTRYSHQNTVPMYCDYDVIAGRTYNYRVAAYSGNGGSRALIGSQSSIASATMAPDAPTVTATAISANSIRISCGQVSGATSYRIYRNHVLVAIIENDSNYSGVQSCYRTDTGLEEGTEYYYRVVAINNGGGTATDVSARTWTVPSAPQNLVVTPAYTGAVLSWQAPASDGGTGITGYQFSVDDGTTWGWSGSWCSENGGTTWINASCNSNPDNLRITISPKPSEGNTSSVIIMNLNNEYQSYRIMVRAVNSVGPGQASNTAYINNLLQFGTVNIGGTDYKTSIIGTQTWMAEPIINGSYSWAQAMDIDDRYDSELWDGSDVNHQGICPSGWHIPSKAEWDALNTAQGIYIGSYFKTLAGLSATQDDATNAYVTDINYIGSSNFISPTAKSYTYRGVICVKNN